MVSQWETEGGSVRLIVLIIRKPNQTDRAFLLKSESDLEHVEGLLLRLKTYLVDFDYSLSGKLPV